MSSDPFGHPLLPGGSSTGQLETQPVLVERDSQSPVGVAGHPTVAAGSTEPSTVDRENEQLAATDGNQQAQQS